MNSYGKGLKDGLPIGLGYLSVSFSFGIKAAAGGLTIFQALLVSMCNMTSAGQVAGLDAMLALAPLLEAALVQLTINIRYSLMSISLSQKLNETVTLPHRLAVSFFNTDEVFAVASSQAGLLGRRYLYGLGTMPYLGWSLGTLLGAAAGTLLPANVSSALGIAIYGMFIAIIVPPAKKGRAVGTVVLLAAALSLTLAYVPCFSGVSAGVAVIVCALAAAGVGALFFPVKEAAP